MPDTSTAQLAANRSNGALSHGPVTPEGKRRSALNALRHGLTGRVAVLPSEDLKLYQAFSAEYIAALEAKGPVEIGLAQNAADHQWRLNRARIYEEGLLAEAYFEEPKDIQLSVEVGQALSPANPESVEQALPPANPAPDPAAAAVEAVHDAFAAARAFRHHSHTLLNLTTYEQRIQHMLERALNQLQKVQTARLTREQEQAKQAERPMDQAIDLLNLHKSEGQPFNPQEFGFVFSKDQIEHEVWRRGRLKAAKIASRFAVPPVSQPAAPPSQVTAASDNPALRL
jgi:hypothetical protein